MAGEVRQALTTQTNRAVRFIDAAPGSAAKYASTTLLIVSPKSASITLPTVSPESPSPTAAPPGERQKAQEPRSKRQDAHEQKQAHGGEEAQEREQAHGGELKVLQALYEERLRSLSARVRETQQTVAGDELVSTMRRDPLSASHVQGRMAEILEAALSSEQEASIGKLCRQLAAARAELGRERAVTGASQLVAAAERQKAQGVQLQEMSVAVVREAHQRHEAQAGLARAQEECGTLRAEVEEARAEVARLNVESEGKARGEAEAVGAQVRHRLIEVELSRSAQDGAMAAAMAGLQGELLATRSERAAAQAEAAEAQAQAVAMQTAAEAAVASAGAERAARGRLELEAAELRAAVGEAEAEALGAGGAAREAAAAAHTRWAEQEARGVALSHAAEAAQVMAAQHAAEAAAAAEERDELRLKYRGLGAKVQELVAIEASHGGERREASLREALSEARGPRAAPPPPPTPLRPPIHCPRPPQSLRPLYTPPLWPHCSCGTSSLRRKRRRDSRRRRRRASSERSHRHAPRCARGPRRRRRRRRRRGRRWRRAR